MSENKGKPNPDIVFENFLRRLTSEEAARIRVTTAVSDGQKSLDRLFDYTKFHIGLYLTLTASYIAVTSIKGEKSGLLVSLQVGWFWLAVICFMIAGFSGGVIVSSITQSNARSSESFLEERIGPLERKWGKARTWTLVEHTAFWGGLVCALISVRF